MSGQNIFFSLFGNAGDRRHTGKRIKIFDYVIDIAFGSCDHRF